MQFRCSVLLLSLDDVVICSVQFILLILDINLARNVHCPQLASASRGEQWLREIFIEPMKKIVMKAIEHLIIS